MIELVLIVIIILAVVGVSIFAWTDYNKHKTENKTDITKVNTDLKGEKETRLANLKFVVDQVNKTNEEMDTTYVKKFDDIDASIKKYNAFEAGFGSLITARNRSSNVDIPITNLATMPATDMNMIKHVSFLGGATIKDLQTTDGNMRVKICGTGATPACIQLPNDAGDTYLTSLVTGKSIVFDAPVKNYNSFDLYAAGVTTAPTMSLKAATETQTNFTMGANGKLSVRTNEATPAELLAVEKGTTTIKNTVTLQNGSGKSATLMVNADGDLNIVANKVRVNGVEVPAVVATSGAAPTMGVTPSAPSTPTVQEPFCTAADNQGKSYQCIETGSALNNQYFKIEASKRRPYADWTQAVSNSGGMLTAQPLTACGELASCAVGEIIPRV